MVDRSDLSSSPLDGSTGTETEEYVSKYEERASYLASPHRRRRSSFIYKRMQ